MERLTERYKEKVFCKSDCSEMIDYAEDCECPHLQKMKEKLAHYEDLEEQGLLLKLPCKVGDKVYYPDKNWCRVFEYSVVSVAKDSTNIWIRCGNGYSFIYGREIFTTLAEAEKALAEMEK